MASIACDELDNPRSQFTIFKPQSDKQDRNGHATSIKDVKVQQQYYYVEDGMLGICWSYVIRLSILHAAAAYGFYRFYLAAVTRSVNPGFYYTWLYSKWCFISGASVLRLISVLIAITCSWPSALHCDRTRCLDRLASVVGTPFVQS